MDLEAIKARLTTSREFWAEWHGKRFKLLRPREIALANIVKYEGDNLAYATGIMKGSCVEWHGVTIDDLFHDGDQTALPYHPDFCDAYLSDNAELLMFLFNECMAAYNAYKTRSEQEKKASEITSPSA